MSYEELGNGEVVNQKQFGRGMVARGSHYLLFGQTNSTNARRRHLAQELLLSPWIFFSENEGLSYQEYKETYSMTVTFG